MQKNYRDYTVGELLDMGLSVEVENFYDFNKDEAELLIKSRFEGITSDSKKINKGKENEFETVRGWSGKDYLDRGFRLVFYLKKEK